MASKKTAIGLEFGHDAIKAVEIRLSGSQASVARSLTIPRAELSEDLRDASPGTGSDAAADAFGKLAAHVRDEMQKAGFRTFEVVLSIDGAESIIRYNQAPPMPASRLALIMKYEVESVAERMGEPVASDYRVLPTIRDDGEQTVLLGLAKEDPLGAMLDALERGGISVVAAVPAPLALFGAWDLFGTKADLDSPDDDLVLVADLGRATLDVTLILNNRLVFARSTAFGGENFTEALAGDLGLTRDQAEKVKSRRGGLDDSIRGVDGRTVNPLRSAAGQLLGMLESSLRFGSSQSGVRLPAVTRLWLTGGGMQLRGLPEYLSRALGRTPWELFSIDGRDSSAESAPCLALPLGLSGVGLQKARSGDTGVFLDILPRKYLERRTFKERTRWLWAAGVALVVLLLALSVNAFLKNSAASGTLEQLQTAHQQLQAQQTERDGWIAASSQTRERIRRLLHEADPTAFQAFVLDFMARRLRAEIQLESFDLEIREVASDDDEATAYEYVVVVRGRIDNRTGRAGDWQLELLEALQASEQVRHVANVPRSGSRDFQSFEFVLHPNPVSL